MEQVRHPSLRSGMGVGINGYQSIKDTMITTTFSYDNCISTYSLVVDRSKTTRAQRWLSSRGVMYRIRFEGTQTRILFHITNVSPAVVRELTNKFGLSSLGSTPTPANAPVAKPKPVAATVFRHTRLGYELVVDNSKAIATTTWLEAKGCQFDRYVSGDVTRYVFSFICGSVVIAIAGLHGCDILAPIPDPSQEMTPTIHWDKPQRMARPGVKGIALSQAFLRVALGNLGNDCDRIFDKMYRNEELKRKVYASFSDADWKLIVAIIVGDEEEWRENYDADVAAIRSGDNNAGEIVFGDIEPLEKYARVHYPKYKLRVVPAPTMAIAS